MPAPFDPGSMRHRLTIQSVVVTTPTPSPAGVPPQTDAEAWEDIGECWGKIEPQRIRRSLGFDAPKDSVWSLVTIRNPGFTLTSNHRFLFQGRILVIDGAQRVDERTELLSVEVTENPNA